MNYNISYQGRGTPLQIFNIERFRNLNKVKGNVKWAELVRATRETLNISQGDFAKIIGVSSGTMSNIESYGVIPKLDVGLKICIQLQISTEEIADAFELNYDEIAHRLKEDLQRKKSV